MLIDTHAHLCSEELYDRSSSIVKELKNEGLESVICPSYDFESNKRTLELSNKYHNVFGALGIHPQNCDCWNEEVREFIEKNIKNSNIVALGEVGLDYHYGNTAHLEQRQILLQQLIIAKNVNMPVIFHIRDAWDDFLDFIIDNRDLVPFGVVHCFDGDIDLARKVLDLGFNISFTGLITYQKPYLWEAVKFVPLERTMLETDSPYLVPKKLQSKIKENEPKNVKFVAEKIAELKFMHVDKVIEQTTDTAYNFFKKMRSADEQ